MIIEPNWFAINARSRPTERERWWRDLTTRYSEPHRYYHTLRHVDALLRWADDLRADLRDYEAVCFAVWFHDAIYDPTRSDNESASATLARDALSSLLVPQSTADKVAKMILATQRHELLASDPDLALFLDFDLSILGAVDDVYDDYAAAVREEYSFVPDPVFGAERKKILDRFLARPRLYFTDVMFERLEERARRNLARELQRLR